MNGHEIAARLAKVEKLVTVLRAADLKADDVRGFDEKRWAMAAILADVKEPSGETRAAVIRRLEVIKESSADAFARLRKKVAAA